MASGDFVSRQHVGHVITVPSKIFFKTMSRKAQETARGLVKDNSIHCRDASKAFLEEAQAQLKTMLKDCAAQSCMTGHRPTAEATITNSIEQTSRWRIVQDSCTCCVFKDHGKCKHYIACRILSGDIVCPQKLRLVHQSRPNQRYNNLFKEPTRKKKARYVSAISKTIRYCQGIEDLTNNATLPNNRHPSKN